MKLATSAKIVKNDQIVKASQKMRSHIKIQL